MLPAQHGRIPCLRVVADGQLVGDPIHAPTSAGCLRRKAARPADHLKKPRWSFTRIPGDGDGSITGCIAGAKAGDVAAAQPLWERQFARMVNLARSWLRASHRRCRNTVSDDEDAALSAFDSLCAWLARGRFSRT
jgi:hypothetical protein